MFGNGINLESLRDVQAEQRALVAREMEQRRILREAGLNRKGDSLLVRIRRFVGGKSEPVVHVRPALDLRR